MKELDSATRSKLDGVLERVKEPQSELSLAELGLVRKFTLSEAGKTIVVYLDMGEGRNRYECPACSLATGLVREGVERALREELAREFPGFEVHFDGAPRE